ncbi:WD40 repeat-like protein [Hesseltinella vesiculosa]|uniref:WD40 repeat-like protein n=1 Tax=Hesseltinella vesiculosa TaxID=101127 RepID=A0A1X2G8B4_9FUNG|nr:WD40 repeat-like protein [Hesseltinella vesiculosa]
MSSDEEDLDLNDDSLPPLDNQSDDGEQDPDDMIDQPSAQPSPSPMQDLPHSRQVDLSIDQDCIDCSSYDIVPMAAAIHPNAIYTLAATRCFRWVFTGSDDGYLRKWDFFASMNGKTALTQAQRHSFADSLSQAGVIASWWENDEQPEPVVKDILNDIPDSPTSTVSTSLTNPPSAHFKETKLSPVFGLAVQSEALWGLQGLESGAVHLTTIRHEEGKCHHVFRKHTAPVSVLNIIPGEAGFLSGSWDRQLLEWDLQQGNVVRQYAGHITQISTTAFQPMFAEPGDKSTNLDDKATTDVDMEDADADTPLSTSADPPQEDRYSPHIFLSASVDGQCLIWDRRMEKEAAKLSVPDKTPPWCFSACWHADGSKIYVGRRNGTVEEWDAKQHQLLQTFRMPVNSGPVYNVCALPNGKHIVCASHDNIRLWNISVESSFTIKTDSPANQVVTPTEAIKVANTKSIIPFTIIPGHHGGMTSSILVDPTSRYMITTSGNRGWEGTSTNSCLFYDISPVLAST